MSVPVSDVYIGAWWSYAVGSNPALVLTLKDREALILIAALVIFTGFVATRVFGVVRFVLHQWRAGTSPSSFLLALRGPRRRGPIGPDRNGRDGFHQQQQALLRNFASHTQSLWIFLQVARGWRGRIGIWTALRRSFLIILVTLASLAAWTAAALLLPLLWTMATNEMLVAPQRCGDITPPYRLPEGNPQRSMSGTNAFKRYNSRKAEAAATYQRQWYGNDTLDPVCERLLGQRIEFTEKQSTCLIGTVPGSFCIPTDSGPIEWDSGYINSNTHLGVNAPREDSVDFRYTITCSPVADSYVVYASPQNSTSGVRRYMYGTTTTGGVTHPYTVLYNESLTQVGTGYNIM